MSVKASFHGLIGSSTTMEALFQAIRDVSNIMVPVILQAESAQLPEMKRVVLADQTQVVWAPEFETSLETLLATGPIGQEEDAVVATAAAEGQPVVSSALRGRMQDAVDAFRSYKEELSAGNFSGAGQSLDSLGSTMQAIGDSLGGADE